MKTTKQRRQIRSSHSQRRNAQSRVASFEPLEERRLLSTNVTLYRYDAVSSGLNPNETVLTPANVVSGSFGKQFTTSVNGQAYAEPLYMSGVNITAGAHQGTHNVVYVATENDSLYAIDAGSGQVLWQDSFLIPQSGQTISIVTSTDDSSGDISPEIGITGTPAINASTGSLYLVAETKAVHGSDTADPHFVATLFDVNIQSGTYSDTVMADTTASGWNGSFYTSYTYNSGPYVYGNGDGAITVGGQSVVYFNALRQMFRPGVALATINGQEQVVLASARRTATTAPTMAGC